MLIPQIPSLHLLWEKKFSTRRPSTSTRHCSVTLSPIAENSPLLPPLLPHQLANQTRAPPRADSSFCSSAYGVLAAVSSCCYPPKGRVEKLKATILEQLGLEPGFPFALLRALGFDGGLKKPPTDALRPIIPDNACILCITAAAGTELADAYSPDTVIASSLGKEESGPCLSPSVADHPIGPATDHRLGKLLPHQLANQTQAPPRADSSFCSSAYGVLEAVSSCCSPPKGRFLRVTHPSATGNTTSRPTCMC
ncbi:hypothetical protein F2Q70_00012149 [Brassica cretica]|uniref:Uncharacterized protein n=1 Tax=Brassica cretica TaxID=69181 RepID=A0A8S9M568_BRACR|nr:hypothetical protein F2Q70_00012149 [Brassica cretica]